jgi:hypothetical protein
MTVIYDDRERKAKAHEIVADVLAGVQAFVREQRRERADAKVTRLNPKTLKHVESDTPPPSGTIEDSDLR